MRPTLIIAAAAAALPTAACPAWAQNNRSFVSSQGSDNNPCTLAAPCRTLAQAVSQTNAKGEVAVLNTAGYGPVTITQAINIVNEDGVEAGVTATSGDGVTITAEPGDVVTLRGLTITGGGTGGNGINFASGAGLQIENCNISGFTQSGIIVQPNAAAKFTITDTVAFNNGTAGISISVPSGTLDSITGMLARDTLINNGTNNGGGLQISNPNNTGLQITLTNSIVSNNTGSGVLGSGSFSLDILQSKISGQSTGLSLSSGAVSLSQMYFANSIDISNTGSATFSSYQNNIIGATGPGVTLNAVPFQ